MSTDLLAVTGVSKVFRIGSVLSRVKLTAVDDVTFAIPREKPVILSIVGESGCGKTTLCKMILRMLDASDGDITLEGVSYKDLKHDKLKFFTEVQPIFQNPFEAFSTRKPVDTYLFNTALRLKIAGSRAEAEAKADEALRSVGMSLDVVRGKYS